MSSQIPNGMRKRMGHKTRVRKRIFERKSEDDTKYNNEERINDASEDDGRSKDEDFDKAYEVLLRHKDDVQACNNESIPNKEGRSKEHNNECANHIDLFADILYETHSIRLGEAEERTTKETLTAIFSSFRLLMKPQCGVNVKKYETLNATVGKAGSGASLRKAVNMIMWSRSAFLLSTENSVSRALRIITTPVFGGGYDIVSLPVFPIKYYTDVTYVKISRGQFVKRGTKNLHLSKRPAVYGCIGQDLVSGSRRLLSSSHALLALIQFTIT